MEGFYTSFNMNEQDKYIEFFQENGFVVIRNVLDDKSCDKTLDEFWSQSLVDKNDPQTWDVYWNSQQFANLSIMGNSNSTMSKMQLENRQNTNIHNVFSNIYKTDKLWVDHDRIGVMRPTININFGDKYLDMHNWKTIDKWLHIDCNPLTGKTDIGGFFHQNDVFINFQQKLFCQGLISLTDARLSEGGFYCVPKSHLNPKIYESMVQSVGNIQVPLENEMRIKIEKIPIQKGSLLIWNSLTAHANYPNNSSNFRAVQYIRMLPITNGSYSPLFPQLTAYPDYFNPSKLGQKLFGMETWN